MAIAHLLINCDLGSEKKVLSELEKFDSVREAKEVYGAYDVIVKLETHSLQELKINIFNDIRRIKNIISTTTLMDSTNYS